MKNKILDLAKKCDIIAKYWLKLAGEYSFSSEPKWVTNYWFAMAMAQKYKKKSIFLLEKIGKIKKIKADSLKETDLLVTGFNALLYGIDLYSVLQKPFDKNLIVTVFRSV